MGFTYKMCLLCPIHKNCFVSIFKNKKLNVSFLPPSFLLVPTMVFFITFLWSVRRFQNVLACCEFFVFETLFLFFSFFFFSCFFFKHYQPLRDNKKKKVKKRKKRRFFYSIIQQPRKKKKKKEKWEALACKENNFVCIPSFIFFFL